MKASQKDFELFKSECQKWIDIFGLNDWKVYYYFTDLNGDYAECVPDYRKCIVKIALNSKFRRKYLDIKKSAKHEIIHLLLSRFFGMARERFISPDEIDNEWERLTRIIEKAIK